MVSRASALLAAERRNPDFLALHDEVTAARIRPLVPVVVLAPIVTSDPGDLTRITDALGVKIRLYPT